MSRMSMSQEEREQKLREMETDLESELGLDTVTVDETVTRRKTGDLQYGKVALGALAAFLLTQVLGRWALQVIAGVSFIAFVIFGILWIISLFKDQD